jgi:hypothetical protein
VRVKCELRKTQENKKKSAEKAESEFTVSRERIDRIGHPLTKYPLQRGLIILQVVPVQLILGTSAIKALLVIFFFAKHEDALSTNYDRRRAPA